MAHGQKLSTGRHLLSIPCTPSSFEHEHRVYTSSLGTHTTSLELLTTAMAAKLRARSGLIAVERLSVERASDSGGRCRGLTSLPVKVRDLDHPSPETPFRLKTEIPASLGCHSAGETQWYGHLLSFYDGAVHRELADVLIASVAVPFDGVTSMQ